MFGGRQRGNGLRSILFGVRALALLACSMRAVTDNIAYKRDAHCCRYAHYLGIGVEECNYVRALKHWAFIRGNTIAQVRKATDRKMQRKAISCSMQCAVLQLQPSGSAPLFQNLKPIPVCFPAVLNRLCCSFTWRRCWRQARELCAARLQQFAGTPWRQRRVISLQVSLLRPRGCRQHAPHAAQHSP